MTKPHAMTHIAVVASAVICTITLLCTPALLQAGPATDSPPLASAQQPAAPESLTIVVKEKFGRDDLVAIIRRTSTGTIVAVKKSELSAGLLMTVLAALPPAGSAAPAQGAPVDMYFRTGTRLRPMAPEERSLLNTLVSRLRSAPNRRMVGVGEVAAISVSAGSVAGLSKGAKRGGP